MGRRRSIRQTMLAAAWALGAAGASAGCGKTDDRPYVWAYLSPVVFQPSCASASCHSAAAAVAGLDFSTPERGYRSLTGLHVWVAHTEAQPDAGCQMEGQGWLCPSPRPLVVPYAPSESRLVAMLRARNAPRMPPDRPLTEPDIALIERWILNGASPSAGVAGPLGGADAAREVGAPSVDAGREDGAVSEDAPLDANRTPADAAPEASSSEGGAP